MLSHAAFFHPDGVLFDISWFKESDYEGRERILKLDLSRGTPCIPGIPSCAGRIRGRVAYPLRLASVL